MAIALIAPSVFSRKTSNFSLPPTISCPSSTAQPPQPSTHPTADRYTLTHKHDPTALGVLHSPLPNVTAAPLPPVTAEPSACQPPPQPLAHTQHNSDTLIITAKSSFSPNFHRAQLEEGVYDQEGGSGCPM